MRKELLNEKDFSKMDLEEWLIETEKLGLSEFELSEHILSKNTNIDIAVSLRKDFNIKDDETTSHFLYNKWNTKNDLYTEITAYKLQSGFIVETKEQAESLSKEIKIRLDLSEIVAEDYVDIIMRNLEIIKQIINQ